jgi:hypothetical protein
MHRILFLLTALSISPAIAADDLGQLIFQDDFERVESQETKDEPGNGWGTNSKSRAKGHKQVDLREGVLHIFMHAEADHAVSVTPPSGFTDGAVGLRFMLEDAQDSLSLNFADLEFKEVHAGHLFAVNVSPKKVQIVDMKSGGMRIDIRKARVAKQVLNAEQQQAIKGKDKTFPHALETGKWHDIVVQVSGDTVTVTINGQKVGSFSSTGMTHPTKRLLRLGVPHKAVVDDVKIWRKK